jgi:hypothetical protein
MNALRLEILSQILNYLASLLLSQLIVPLNESLEEMDLSPQDLHTHLWLHFNLNTIVLTLSLNFHLDPEEDLNFHLNNSILGFTNSLDFCPIVCDLLPINEDLQISVVFTLEVCQNSLLHLFYIIICITI